jgi:hypothetical protein
MMRRNDLDMLFDNGLDNEAETQAFESLVVLCSTLEKIVAPNLWVGPLSESEKEYPKLERLLRELDSTEWRFHMASGSRGRKIFSTSEYKLVGEQINSFNVGLNRFTQSEIRELEAPNLHQAEQGQSNESHGQLQKAIKTLQALLHWLTRLASTSCQQCHNVLLQLPEWDANSCSERLGRPQLDLYISCCQSSEWQESRLHEISDRCVLPEHPVYTLMLFIADEQGVGMT